MIDDCLLEDRHATLFDVALDQLESEANADLIILRLNQRFLTDLVLTIRAAGRFSQHALDGATPSGNFCKNPVERNLGIVGMTVFNDSICCAALCAVTGSTVTSSMPRPARNSSPSKPLCNVHSSACSS